MLALLMLAAAAAQPVGALPIPINPDKWIDWKDLAVNDIDFRGRRLTRIELTLDGDGLPMTCQLLDSSGFPNLDTKACTLMLQRARYKPARDEDGTAVASRIRLLFHWLGPLGDPPEPPIALRADTIVRTDALDHGDARLITLRVVMDEHGAVASCLPERPDRVGGFGLSACRAMAAAPPKPATDKTMRPLRTMVEYKVGFVTRAPGPRPLPRTGPLVRRSE